MAKSKSIPFRIHPRAFEHLGSELVTSDFVAFTELVKNAYDASANRVDVRFKNDPIAKEKWIEIQDDGHGMTKDVITNVWCMVATPYRLTTKFSGRGDKKRRVTGEKGLGRLAAGRLGKKLTLITQAEDDKCWKVELNWNALINSATINKAKVRITDITKSSPFSKSGTILIIEDLNRSWSETDTSKIDKLKESFTRFIAPITNEKSKNANEKPFEIWLSLFDLPIESIELHSPEFLSKPPYLIKGTFDGKNKLKYTYVFSDLKSTRDEKEEIEIIPTRVRTGEEDEPDKYTCGSFEFEIKAWDMDRDGLTELSERFNLGQKAATLRRLMKRFTGVSLYRDGILVLPKSEKSMDWLGMDLRRVSEVGTRLSTSQVIGYISITAEGNPDLKDTSNRESLRDDIASRDFYDAIMEVIRNLERLRKDNRNETEKEMPFRELFEQLSPKSLISKVNEMAARGETARAVMPEIEEYGQSVERSVAVIEKRLVHYSRLATIGALAAMVMHEIRNRTVIFGSFVEKITEYFKKSNLNFEKLAKHTQLAESAIYTLQRMADKFAPLANRSFGKRRRDCFLEEIIDECVEMRTQDIEKKGITVEYPKGKKNYLAVDLGDLSAILLNLFDNSIYWLSGTEKGKRKIAISYQLIDKGTRVRIHFDDSGPGISKDHIEKVFWPGVTTRQDGLGMGLTVAAELVDQYGGKMTAVDHGTLKGAGFIFDLPLSERE